MAWISGVRRMPWRLLIDHAPTLVDAARRLYVGSYTAAHPLTRERTGDVEELQRVIDQLEAREIQHAAVLEQLAKQVDGLTAALEVLRARVRWAWIGAAVAVAVAVAAALFLRR